MASVHTEPAPKKIPGRDSLNNKAWLVLNKKHNILENIDKNGSFTISSKEIDTVREARLMAKFDHFCSQPEFLRSNNIQILPIENGLYVLGRFNLFHNIEPFTGTTIKKNAASLCSRDIRSCLNRCYRLLYFPDQYSSDGNRSQQRDARRIA